MINLKVGPTVLRQVLTHFGIYGVPDVHLVKLNILQGGAHSRFCASPHKFKVDLYSIDVGRRWICQRRRKTAMF